MINEEEIFSKIHIMPENLKAEILDYIEFLFDKYKLEQNPKISIKNIQTSKNIYNLSENFDESLNLIKERKIFGRLKGFVKNISEDFDESLEDFKEYMY